MASFNQHVISPNSSSDIASALASAAYGSGGGSDSASGGGAVGGGVPCRTSPSLGSASASRRHETSRANNRTDVPARRQLKQRQPSSSSVELKRNDGSLQWQNGHRTVYPVIGPCKFFRWPLTSKPSRAMRYRSHTGNRSTRIRYRSPIWKSSTPLSGSVKIGRAS